jgi:hypothetical protein
MEMKDQIAITEQFKAAMQQFNNGVSDAWLNRDGHATVIVSRFKAARKIAVDLARCGFGQIQLIQPDASNPFCSGKYTVRGSVKA